jgi:lipoprotein-anchoring transpeptidase ErfK/SrfK
MTCRKQQISGARAVKRLSLALFRSVTVAGCQMVSTPDPKLSARDVEYLAKAPKAEIDRSYHRYLVDDPTGEAPGTIVVDTKSNYLYLVEPGRKAIRYGVASGTEAAGWTGVATIGGKQEWPRWIPPQDMLQRWPHLKPTAAAGGLPGGPDNPLGARALYLHQGGKDTLYRIHGTNEPETIGRGASSGCIRMTNVDAIDLYNRVKVGTKVIVR